MKEPEGSPQLPAHTDYLQWISVWLRRICRSWTTVLYPELAETRLLSAVTSVTSVLSFVYSFSIWWYGFVVRRCEWNNVADQAEWQQVPDRFCVYDFYFRYGRCRLLHLRRPSQSQLQLQPLLFLLCRSWNSSSKAPRARGEVCVQGAATETAYRAADSVESRFMIWISPLRRIKKL